MAIEKLLIDLTLKAAAGQFGKKIGEAMLNPLVDGLQNLIPSLSKEMVEKIEKGVVSDEDVAFIRQHIVSNVNHTEDFKILVRDSFDLSGATVEQFMQHLKALESNLAKHQKLLKQYERASTPMQGDFENMIEQVSEKIAFHEEKALGFLKVD